MFQQKTSQRFIVKSILIAIVLLSAAFVFGIVMYSANNFSGASSQAVLENNIKDRAHKILQLNNIKKYSLVSVQKGKVKLPGQFEISKAILVADFPDLTKYMDDNVWQAIFNGETGDLEYSVIFDSNGETAIAAFKNDKRAVPGIEPLKLEVALPDVDNREAVLGQDFLITLPANPTTGYSWKAKFDENYLSLRSKDFVADKASPDTVGSGGTEVFTFNPIKAGEVMITMSYERSWENIPTEIKVFKYTIREVVSELPTDLYVCKLDADCVKVDSGCCGCNAGGNASSINKIYENIWKNKISNDCKEISCPAVMSNDPSCSGVLKCINNKCTIK